jgi:hypothetical protein
MRAGGIAVRNRKCAKLHRVANQSSKPMHKRAPYKSSSALGCVLIAALWAGAGCSADEQSNCFDLPGSTEEFSRTPRADANLELLALRLSNRITARDDIYERVRKDVAAIRNLDARMESITYSPRHNGRNLMLSFDSENRKAVDGGNYDSWSCLNKHFHAESIDTTDARIVKITFRGNLDMDQVARLYAGLPGVKVAEPVRPVVLDQSFTLCVTPEGERWHYVFSDADKTLHYFVSTERMDIAQMGRWSLVGQNEDGTQRPPWVQQYWNEKACR